MPELNSSAMPAKPNYKSFRQFNKTPIPSLAHSRSSVTTPMAARVFNSDSLQARYVRELALEKTLPVKEVLESFEFFARARKHVRTRCVADLCCGHGLTGILFALFERVVERVTVRRDVLLHHRRLAEPLERRAHLPLKVADAQGRRVRRCLVEHRGAAALAERRRQRLRATGRLAGDPVVAHAGTRQRGRRGAD